MSESTPNYNDTQPKSCLKGCFIVLVIFVLLLGAVATLAYYWIDAGLEAELEAINDEVRAMGYPATLEELDAWYQEVPDAENAALKYLDIADYASGLDAQYILHMDVPDLFDELENPALSNEQKSILLENYLVPRQELWSMCLEAFQYPNRGTLSG